MNYPDDDTGQVLSEMNEAGIDLNVEHKVTFFQLFEKEEHARVFAIHLEENFSEMSVIVKPDEIPNVWDVDCTLVLTPSYQNIVDKEVFFEKLAGQFEGYNDGWGIEA